MIGLIELDTFYWEMGLGACSARTGRSFRLLMLMVVPMLLFFMPCVSADPMRSPFTVGASNNDDSPLPDGQERLENNSALSDWDMTGLFVLPLRLYNTYLTTIDGRECPCYPSCSAYAIQAVKKHGFFAGTLFFIDRLIHESDEIHRSSLILLPQGLKVFDPLESNDFWSDRPTTNQLSEGPGIINPEDYCGIRADYVLEGF
ncbi:membrane protein insertion efficiency factor YidD [bacterium]|nr:membrane protein insertion efficiency factor YidD [bacterium]